MGKAIQLVSVAEAKSKLSRLLAAVEDGAEVVITRRGKPVALVTHPPIAKGDSPKLGTLAGKVRFMAGWDEPITEQELLGE